MVIREEKRLLPDDIVRNFGALCLNMQSPWPLLAQVDFSPVASIFLILPQVFHCLDEYWKGYHTPLDFSGDLYRESYESTLEMIEMIKKNDYHKAKLDRARREWAQRGM